MVAVIAVDRSELLHWFWDGVGQSATIKFMGSLHCSTQRSPCRFPHYVFPGTTPLSHTLWCSGKCGVLCIQNIPRSENRARFQIEEIRWDMLLHFPNYYGIFSIVSTDF